MVKQEGSDFYAQWYKLWMEQSKEFFDSAEKNLKNVFGQQAAFASEENKKQINDWLATLKQHWDFAKLSEEQKAYAVYWQKMAEMCKEASDKMVEEWIKRSQENNPIKNAHELYELWLKCCNDIYQKTMQTKSYQEAYGEFMNAAMKFWKNSMPK